MQLCDTHALYLALQVLLQGYMYAVEGKNIARALARVPTNRPYGRVQACRACLTVYTRACWPR